MEFVILYFLRSHVICSNAGSPAENEERDLEGENLRRVMLMPCPDPVLAPIYANLPELP